MRRKERREEKIETDDRVICTLAAFLPLLALFLAVEEIRAGEKTRLAHFSLCSSALLCIHIVWALVILGVNYMLYGVPILGFVTGLVLWIVYLAGAIALIAVRVGMMHAAWQNEQYDLPILGRFLEERFEM